MSDESCDFWHSHVPANSCLIILLFWEVTNLDVADFLLNAGSLVADQYTGLGRNNSKMLKVNKNQTKQGIQKILLFIKSTYDAFFSKHF